MIKNLRFHAVSGLAAAAIVALCMLTIGTVASTPFTQAPRPGGVSVVYKNGDTPAWMERAMARANDGMWL